MFKGKFAIFFDSVIIGILISFLIFVWGYKITKNAKTCFFVCIFILFVLIFLFFCSGLKKYGLNKLKFSDSKKEKLCYETIINLKKSELEIFYEKLLSAKPIQKNIYENENNLFYINLQRKLNENDFITANEFYQGTDKSKPLSFLSLGYSESFTSFQSIATNKYNTYDFAEVFLIMKETNIFPKNFSYENPKRKKIKFSEIKNKFVKALPRSKFKEFFFTGISLITFSIFVPYSVYYLIFGSLMLLLSIFCLFSKQKQKQANKQELISLIKKDTNQ